jgi:outer membrane protein TolC
MTRAAINGLALAAALLAVNRAAAQTANGPVLRPVPPAVSLPLPPRPEAVPDTKPYPINLPTALRLANVNPLDVALATARLRVAAAQYDRAKVLWLPNINAGVDYFRSDGRIQDVTGNVFTTSKSTFLVGAGPAATFAVTEAIHAPLAARQVILARSADVQAARNDSLNAVAEAYFNVQQARGEVAGSIAAAARADDLVRRTDKLAPGFVPTVEVSRARAELARRRQAVESAYERWQVASSDLARLLLLDPTTVVVPEEDPDLRVELVDLSRPVDELIPLALTSRPELASNQALVQATLARLRQEKVRPLVPSIIIRGVGSNQPGLMGGYFGGGINDNLSNFGARNAVDIQAIWEFQNLGFGNAASVHERQADNRVAMLELFRTQDRVAAEVAQALARAKRATARVAEAEAGVRAATESADKNLQGLGETQRIGERLLLVLRPQEAVAAVTALDQAYRDYYTAVADSNRAHFALYRALGCPAQGLLQAPPVPPPPPPPPAPSKDKKSELRPVSHETLAPPNPPSAPASSQPTPPVHRAGAMPAWMQPDWPAPRSRVP